MTGTLYGVGVGPGDPELLTLKAHRLIISAPVLAYPVNSEGNGFAQQIVGNFIQPESVHLLIAIPMKTERSPAQCAYDSAAEKISVHLESGRDVVFLCEGDPFFFGSFMYLFERLNGAHTCKVVPGVTSLTACAAELGRPLAARNDVLKVLPAPLDAETLTLELQSAQSAAIIKVGRHFEKVRAVLQDLELSEKAWIVEAATNPHQTIRALNDVPHGERPYFSTILIYRGDEPW
ncbi:MAG: precorrin-2 C(20)-methyltransferase [Pseudomonadota bacterium]